MYMTNNESLLAHYQQTICKLNVKFVKTITKTIKRHQPFNFFLNKVIYDKSVTKTLLLN